MRITHTLSLQETRQEANCTAMYFNKPWKSEEISKNQRLTATTAIFKQRKRLVILTHCPAKQWNNWFQFSTSSDSEDKTGISVSLVSERHPWFSYDEMIGSVGAREQCSYTLVLQGLD